MDMLAGLYYAVDTHGDVYVVSEVYKPGLVVSDACVALREGNPFETQNITTYAPPDLWSRTKDTGKQISELFDENGVPLIPSSNARIPGWMELHERLKVMDRIQEDGEHEKTARIKIFSGCKNLIRCLSTIKADEKNINDVSTEPHELTHLPDSLRYFCVQHTVPAREVQDNSEESMLAKYKAHRLGQHSKQKIYR
jgi:phage terminase large subunit